MSMDYKKGVYAPVRDHTRKITAYGQMNTWHDYKVPLSLGERPRVPHIKNSDPLGPGVEISVPTNPMDALMEPSELEKQRLRQLVAAQNKRELAEASALPTSADLKKYLYKKKQLSPIYSGEEPVVVGGRILRPDPMMMGSGSHLEYTKSGGYDDYHKTYLKLQKDGIYPSYPMYGPPRFHNGKSGGSWKHVKNVLQAGGQRRVFVDGTPRLLENSKMTFGEVPGAEILYPPARRNPHRAFTDPYKITMTDSYRQAIRQTEGSNWNLLR